MRNLATLRRIGLLVLAAVAILLVSSCSQHQADNAPVVRFAISPFQDTLVPLVSQEKGWYKQEGLTVDLKILGWTEVMEALSSGQVDVAINNISSVIATHERNPQLVYYYGLNPFDDGFALMIRPKGSLKPLSQMLQLYASREEAVRATAAQLRGRSVVTTSKTDMEQGVAAAARRGGLDFRKDVRIIDLNPDEGLAAFLRGEGDAYIGGIPQRTRAAKEGMIEMLTGADIGPPPINGLVTTKQYAKDHQDVMLKLLHVWFRTVRYIDSNIDDGGGIIIKVLNRYSAGDFTLDDFKRYWNHFEHYPATPRAASDLILSPSGRNYWKARWEDCNLYFFEITHTISKPVDASDAFYMPLAQEAYVHRYGDTE